MTREFQIHLSMMILCAVFWGTPGLSLSAGIWVSNGPYGGGTVECMVLSSSRPEVMYVSTFTYGVGGLFKSVDGGEHWKRLDIPVGRFRSIGVDPKSADVIYAVSRQTIYRSTDGGASWTKMMRLGSDVGIRSITVDPTRSGVVYAATMEWIFKTTDGGATWTHLGGFPDRIPDGSQYDRGYFNAFAVTVSPEDPDELYVGTNPGAYRSEDGGVSWRRMGPDRWWWGSLDVSVFGILIDPRDPDLIYCHTTDGGYRSGDRGATWEKLHYYANEVAIVAVDPSTGDVYASSANRLFRSSDRGETWVQILDDLRHDALSPLLIHPHTPEILYTVDDKGLLKTTDAGGTWRYIHRGFNNTTIFSIAVHPFSKEVFAAAGNRGVYRSRDGGRTWEKLSGVAVDEIVFDPETGDMYASGGNILKSRDGGITWQPSGTGIPYMSIAVLAVDPSNSEVLLAAGTEAWEGKASGVYRSADRGKTWIEANAGLPFQPDVWSLVMDPTSSGIVYVGTYTDGVYKSLDGGLSWFSSSKGLSKRWVLSLAIDPTFPSVLYAGTPNGVSKSIDAGAHWFGTGLTRGPVRALLVHPRRSGWVYAGGDMGVYRSRDGGVTWTEINEGLLVRKVKSLAIDPMSDVLYAGTAGGGVYQRDVSPDSDEPVMGRPGWIKRTLRVEDAHSQSRSYKGDLGDYEGDGDLDYIVANIFGHSRVFVNDGQGHFTPYTPFPEGSARVMKFADHDGDGDLDVAEGSSDRRRSYIYVHNDDGTFTRIVELKGGDVRDFEWADYNGDGYLDVAVAYEQDQGYEDGQHNLLCIGNGDWGFEQQYAFGSRLTMALCACDFDNDGDLDVALGNGSFDGDTVVRNELYLNDGKGTFVGRDEFGWGATWDIECGDLDGDGDLDVVVANAREPLSIYFNRGDLRFERRYLSDAAGGGDLAIDLADFDEDGDLDITAAMNSPASGVTLFVNRGDATFDEVPNFPEAGGAQDVLWGDADGDGDLDLFVSRYRANNIVYLNPGGGLGPVTSVQEVEEASRPLGYRLFPNAPNPFNAETSISYEVAKTGLVRLSVYTLTGQCVRTLVDGERSAGTYSVTWDGKDDAGQSVSSGVYLYRLNAAGRWGETKKMLLVR